MRRRAWLACSAGLWLVVCLPETLAQNYVKPIDDTLRISRPGSRGPSETIGGEFTRASPLDMTRRKDVSLLGQTEFNSRARERRGSLGSMMPASRLGLLETPLGLGLTNAGAMSSPSAVAWKRNADASMISGLSAAQSLQLDLPGENPNQLPALNAGFYTPRPETTRVQELLGLAPAPAESGKLAVVPDTMASRLDALTTARLQDTLREALDLYRAATVEARDVRTERYETCVTCADKLVRAMQQLSMVTILDSQSYLAPLLVAHAALEQERPRQAIDQLLEAFRRQPDFLLNESAAAPFDRYFGDAQTAGAHSNYLAVQMRRYQRVGEAADCSARQKALEAYCLWRLGERTAARDMLAQIEKAAADEPDHTDELLNFAAAMRAALKQVAAP